MDPSSYAWAEAEEAICLTFVEGLTEAEVVALYPAATGDQTGYEGLRELSFAAWDGEDARRDCVGGVTTLGTSGWVLIVEINGYGGTLPETHRALAARGYVISVFTNVNAVTTVQGTRRGEAEDTIEVYPAMIERFSVEMPTPKLASGEVAVAMREVGLLTEEELDALPRPEVYFGTVTARCLAFCERATGVAVTEDDVKDAQYSVIRIPV